MPNDNDNNDLSDLSIDEINDLYSDIIEFPQDVRISGNAEYPIYTNAGYDNYCGGRVK